MKEFIKDINELAFLVRDFGPSQYFKKHKIGSQIIIQEFLAYSSEGFKNAQLRVIDLLKEEKNKQEQSLANRKQARSEKKKDNQAIKKYSEELKLSKFKESILRNVIDSIVWQIFGGKREIIARLFLEEKGSKSLDDVGFLATLELAEQINEDPLKFALVSDLSENIQVGDLIVWSVDGLDMIEVKTGKKEQNCNRSF